MRKAIVFLLLALPLFASEPKLEDVAWISGHWSLTNDGATVEEVWLAPSGGLMTGMGRTVKNGRASFEFLRIQTTKDGVFYFAQPGGRPETPFRLVEATSTRAVFANPAHDFPQRILYTLRDGRLCARVEGAMNGKEAAEEWCWSRVPSR
jgi:Domain of unknown function (DUF6265)